MPLPKFSLAVLRSGLRQFSSAPRTRLWVRRLAIFIAGFGMVVFFGGPPLLRHFAEHQLSQIIMRPVSVRRIALNPYTLRLEVDQLRIGERTGGVPDAVQPGQAAAAPGVPTPAAAFIEITKVVVRPSWSSLFRLKPVIGELYIEAPLIHLVRTAPQRFNFSDLLDTFAKPATPGSQPARFSVSNIRLENGRIDFDDQALGTHHTLDQWRIGIPFIANLPAKTDIFVQPLLQARIDGSLLRVTGQTKPFSNTLESTLALQIDQFDLTRLLPYLPYAMPQGLPFKLQQGWLSTQLNLAFTRVDSQPQLKFTGTVDLRDLSLADSAAVPLFNIKSLHLEAADIEPLRNMVHLADLRLDAPQLALSRDAQGRINLFNLVPSPGAGTASAPSRAASVASASSASAATTASVDQNAAFDFAIQHFALNNGAVSFADSLAGKPARLALTQLGLTLADFSTVTRSNAHFTLQTQLEQGGRLNGEGSLNVPAHQLTTRLTLQQLALPALQPWLDSVVDASIGSGLLSIQADLNADWSAPITALTVSPAQLDLDSLKVLHGRNPQAVLALGHGTVQLKQLDLATRQADLSEIDLDGLVLNANRETNGQVDLASLLKHGQEPASRPIRRTGNKVITAAAPAWRYQVGTLNVTHSSVALTDKTQAPHVSLSLAPLQLKVSQISDAFDKPWQVVLSSTLNKKGGFTARGTLKLAPLDVALRLQAKQLDLAAFEPYFGATINASIASALFNADGDLAFGQGDHGWHAAYQGDAGLDKVRMLDKQSADLFAGWGTLALSRIKAHYDAGGTDLNAGRVALSNFYARIFLDQNGRLNLSNFIAQQAAPDASLTRTDAASADAASAAAATRTAQAASAATSSAASANSSTDSSAKPQTATAGGPPFNLHFGELLLQHGHINYTDDFIKPNFTANLVEINGKIGAFGTHTTQPASVEMKASLDARGPVSINGTVNPLATPPALDMTASAQGIELTSFTPYSTKYAGYPITEGRLNVDLHYLLDSGRLSADNHLFIDQLTFGEHVENSTATHLPVTLAIALLKNSRGQIDINIPVSGSLSDPQFSVGGLIWHALLNLIGKAVTAPFSLLANAFGSSEELQYVAFQPGTATLSAEDQKKLDTLGQALNDKPAVRLELIGRADPAVDGPALRQLAVQHAVLQAKIKDVVGHGQSIEVSEVKVAPDEYEKYLARAYKAADFKKPHNLIGLNKSLPAAEMAQLMADNTPITDAALRSLAQQRVAAVHQWLDSKVAAARLYDRSPKIDATGINDKGATTRVDFVLK